MTSSSADLPADTSLLTACTHTHTHTQTHGALQNISFNQPTNQPIESIQWSSCQLGNSRYFNTCMSNSNNLQLQTGRQWSPLNHLLAAVSIHFQNATWFVKYAHIHRFNSHFQKPRIASYHWLFHPALYKEASGTVCEGLLQVRCSFCNSN